MAKKPVIPAAKKAREKLAGAGRWPSNDHGFVCVCVRVGICCKVILQGMGSSGSLCVCVCNRFSCLLNNIPSTSIQANLLRNR